MQCNDETRDFSMIILGKAYDESRDFLMLKNTRGGPNLTKSAPRLTDGTLGVRSFPFLILHQPAGPEDSPRAGGSFRPAGKHRALSPARPGGRGQPPPPQTTRIPEALACTTYDAACS